MTKRRRRGSIKQPSAKRVPQRTCVACRKVKDKKELVRLVRVSDGTIEIDASGKKAGRGAYLCRARECGELGFKNRRLEQTLRTTLTKDNREKLIGSFEELIAADGEK